MWVGVPINLGKALEDIQPIKFSSRQQQQQRQPTQSRQQDYDDLLYKLEYAIQRLYDAGARKIVILGLPPIGCFPMQVTASSLFSPNHWFQHNCDNNQNSDSKSCCPNPAVAYPCSLRRPLQPRRLRI
ncbi:hypothetical protein MLD38_035477 [Melastoma candidum]|uniref:Uncharacterized protein n=1 Tax=Melastoma candidum TaxID=119954 RepID=A0ACB9LHB2_9MYRT|nr:hypothetical protein MLD38_035477 [Melastoma candidum]